jgi:hypothetical protein
MIEHNSKCKNIIRVSYNIVQGDQKVSVHLMITIQKVGCRKTC